MARRRFPRFPTLLGVVALSVLSFMTCSTDHSSPLSPPVVGDEIRRPNIRRSSAGPEGPSLAAADLDADFLAKVLRTRENLLLTSKDVEVVVPAGETISTDAVTVSVDDPTLFLFDLGPDGMKFQRPVFVSIDYTKADLSQVAREKDLQVWWIDGNTPVEVKTHVDKNNDRAWFKVDHFSRYALSVD